MNQLNICLRDRLSEALNALPDLDLQVALTIHELRKQTKFIRALLLLHQAVPPELNQSLKMLSALLAPYRDAQVNLDTYKLLTDNAPALQDAGLEISLRSNPFFLDSAPTLSLKENIELQFTELSLAMLQIPVAPGQKAIFDVIQGSYESGSTAMHQVRQNSNMEDLHTWRKKTKRLWYQLRFLFGDLIDDLNHPLNLSDQLGQLLGEIHDSDVFELLLAARSNLNLHQLINSRRSELLLQAFDLGDRLYIQGQPIFSQLLQTAR